MPGGASPQFFNKNRMEVAHPYAAHLVERGVIGSESGSTTDRHAATTASNRLITVSPTLSRPPAPHPTFTTLPLANTPSERAKIGGNGRPRRHVTITATMPIGISETVRRILAADNPATVRKSAQFWRNNLESRDFSYPTH